MYLEIDFVAKKIKQTWAELSDATKVVVPEVKSLFDECEWRPFFSLSFPSANTWDIEMRAIALSRKKVYRHHACGEDINSAMYIDVRTREDDIPWDETDEYITKITPQ